MIKETINIYKNKSHLNIVIHVKIIIIIIIIVKNWGGVRK